MQHNYALDIAAAGFVVMTATLIRSIAVSKRTARSAEAARIVSIETELALIKAENKMFREQSQLSQWVAMMHSSPLNRDTQQELDDLLDKAKVQTVSDSIGVLDESLTETDEVRMKVLLLERLNDPLEKKTYKIVTGEFLKWLTGRQAKRLTVPTAVVPVTIAVPPAPTVLPQDVGLAAESKKGQP